MGCLEGFPLRYCYCLQTRATQKLCQHSRSRAEATGRARAAFPAGSCHRAQSECSWAPFQSEGNLRPPVTAEFTAGNIQLQTGRAGSKAEEDNLQRKAWLRKF